MSVCQSLVDGWMIMYLFSSLLCNRIIWNNTKRKVVKSLLLSHLQDGKDIRQQETGETNKPHLDVHAPRPLAARLDRQQLIAVFGSLISLHLISSCHRCTTRPTGRHGGVALPRDTPPRGDVISAGRKTKIRFNRRQFICGPAHIPGDLNQISSLPSIPLFCLFPVPITIRDKLTSTQIAWWRHTCEGAFRTANSSRGWQHRLRYLQVSVWAARTQLETVRGRRHGQRWKT